MRPGRIALDVMGTIDVDGVGRGERLAAPGAPEEQSKSGQFRRAVDQALDQIREARDVLDRGDGVDGSCRIGHLLPLRFARARHMGLPSRRAFFRLTRGVPESPPRTCGAPRPCEPRCGIRRFADSHRANVASRAGRPSRRRPRPAPSMRGRSDPPMCRPSWPRDVRRDQVTQAGLGGGLAIVERLRRRLEPRGIALGDRGTCRKCPSTTVGGAAADCDI